MYQLGHSPRKYRSRKPIWIGFGCLVALVVIGLLIAPHFAKSDTTLQQAQPVVRKVTAKTTAVKGFDEPGFELELPSDWKLVSHTDKPYNLYYFQGTTAATRGRILEIYQDTLPAKYMVNRVQPVEANVNHISVIGNMSENCADFTKGPPALGSQGTPAKWESIDFLCDLNNTERNVIGTSSLGNINKVTLKGATGTVHSFFLAYSDHSINPDYTTFYNAISSFTSK